ncbi:hypothetical protein MKW98_032764 [Papaver atlanticum]|uniref:Uncharacterized protein n=1 Tax=Papaver atlanticum TaxID=357466 RepID=A0AAD4RZ65_9MAGN|nr:hypothetical protein MKW98_032764 [Papaver atlanticum]
MKRSREGDIVSKEQTVEDASIDYLKAVKNVFDDNKEKYDEFLQILIGAAKSWSKDIAELVVVLARIKALLNAHPHLILAFNTFLPKECQITLTEEDGGDFNERKRPHKLIKSAERTEESESNEALHPTTKLECQVLNNVCALDGISFDTKEKPNSRYEKMQIKCEDYRFHLDILIGYVDSTKMCVEELVGKIQDNTVKPETQIHIEDHLTPANLRCIKRLLRRCKQKQQELSCDRSEFDKVWAYFVIFEAKSLANNYNTSLDKRILRYISSKMN